MKNIITKNSKRFVNLKCANKRVYKHFQQVNYTKNKNNIKKYVVKKRIIDKSEKCGIKSKIALILSGVFIGILNGFFGGGGGMVCVPILRKFLSLNDKESHATTLAIIFPLSIISAFSYVFNGFICSMPLLSVAIGVTVGGVLGAFALKILPSKIIRIIFAIIMLIGGIKLII